MVEYCGFRYDADSKGYFNIVPNKNVLRPKTLFKYYALTENSVDALTNMYIYATHPNQFNDPFDCNEKLVEFNTWDDVKNLWGDSFEKIKEEYHSINEACKDSSYVYKTLLYRKLGLFSLAPVGDNYIMWSLYAQNKGFCVEFKVEQFPFRHFGPFPINYVESIQRPIHIGKVGGNVAMLIQSNVKNKWWQYENEWRLYVPNPPGLDMKSIGNEADKYNRFNEHNRKFYYQINAVSSVALGTSFFNNCEINDVSSKEIEVICGNNENNQYVSRILNFLSMQQEGADIPVYLSSLSGFSEYDFIPIHILKNCDNHYRIFENDI